jgi:hypothetical protein
LKLSDGVNPVVSVADGAAGDLNGAAGVVTVVSSLGSFVVNVATGVSNPVLSGPYPHMDLNSINVNTGGAGTLQVMLSQTGFTSAEAALAFLTTWGGTLSGAAGSTVDLDVFINTDDSLFGTTGTNVGDLGPFGAGAFAGSTSGVAAVDDSYSVTIIMNLHANGAITYSGDAELQQVPEPMTLGLLGAGLLGMGIAARRRRQS